MDVEVRINAYVVNVGHAANVERIIVGFTPDLETIWPVVFQLQV